MIPDAVRSAVETALEEGGFDGVRIAATAPIGGGCISPAARLDTVGGARYFLKWGGAGLPDGMLAAEADGLRALAGAGALRVPAVAGLGADPAWLLLEWLEPGAPGPGSWEALGRGLAGVHRHRSARHGAASPNYIGPLPQSNEETDDWPGFWRSRRLEPRLRGVRDRGLLGAGDAGRFERLFAVLDDLLAPATEDGPSLLHGDLWSGNVHMLADGEPAVIDPSAYHGHREVDLAMADLFGGFERGFWCAYEEEWPLAPGWERRRAVYQLYYLLVHVELFGAGYLGRTRAALDAAGS